MFTSFSSVDTLKMLFQCLLLYVGTDGKCAVMLIFVLYTVGPLFSSGYFKYFLFFFCCLFLKGMLRFPPPPFFFLKDLIHLFQREYRLTQGDGRGAEREGENLKQTMGWVQSLMWGSIPQPQDNDLS